MMKSRVSNQAGQTITEFALTSSVILLTIVGSGWLLHAEWKRAQCAYLTFEATHARLVGKPLPPTRIQIRTWEDEKSVSGAGKCSDAEETVKLNKLESG